MFKLAAVLFLTGTAAHSCFATEISETFVGITTQVAGNGSGIFNVSGSSPVYGTLTFNPADFTPDPVAPSASTYLNVFTGAAGSVKMALSDAGGTGTVDAQSSFLEVSSSSNAPWALVASSDQLSFSLTLQSAVTFPAGSSLFDLSDLNAAGISVLVSDSSDSLGFDISAASVAPEPSGELLLAAGLCGLLFYWKYPRSGTSFRSGTLPGFTHPKSVFERLLKRNDSEKE